MKSRTAVLVSVGDELLAGAHPDLNGPMVAAALAELGVATRRVIVVGDSEAEIADAVAEGARAAGLVVVTGGLGPTLDDVTRHGVARAARLELETSPVAQGQIEAWYAKRGGSMPISNLRQALVPRGATVLANAHGTAPGFRCEVEGAVVAVLPGPPREARGLLQDELLPWLEANLPAGDAREVAIYSMLGLSESVFADRAVEWLERDVNPLLGVTVKEGILTVRIKGSGATSDAARELVRSVAEPLSERFREWIYSDREEGVEAALGRELLARDLSVTLAESCTGGGAASLLTRVPGISTVFRSSFVTYSDEAKQRDLGVPPELLAEHGAVSEAVACAMASGARERAGADLAVSVTGVAGPSGGSAEKPVGLVWFGISSSAGTRAEEQRFPPVGRERIRAWAARRALWLLLAEARAAG